MSSKPPQWSSPLSVPERAPNPCTKEPFASHSPEHFQATDKVRCFKMDLKKFVRGTV